MECKDCRSVNLYLTGDRSASFRLPFVFWQAKACAPPCRLNVKETTNNELHTTVSEINRGIGHIIKTLCLVVVLLPLLTSAGDILLHGIPDGFIDGDNALIGLMAHDASNFDHLLGLSSRTGFHHPGPLYFYLLWPLYSFTDYHSFSLDLTVIILNLLFIGGMVILIQRECRNTMLLAWFVLLMAQYLRYLGPIAINFWTPFASLFAFWCGALCLVAVACGKKAYLPIAVAILSFVVQTHFGHAPAVAATAVLAMLLLCFSPIRRLFKLTPDKIERLLPVLAASLILLMILWLPPLVEQCSSESGNLTKMVTFFQEHQTTRSWHETYSLSTQNFSHYLLSWCVYVNPWQQFHIDPRAAQWIFWAQLGLLGGAYFIFYRQRQAFLRILTIFVLVWHIVLVISIQRIIGEVFPHLVIWMGAIGMLTWFVIGAALICLGKKFSTYRYAHSLEGILLTILLAGIGTLTYHSTRGLHQETLYALKHRNTLTATSAFHKIVETTFETMEKYRARSCMITLLDRDIWPAVAGLALEFFKADIPFSLNPKYPSNSYSGAYLPTTTPDGQLILALKATADRVPPLQSWLLIRETKTMRVFWRPLPEQLDGRYLFDFPSLFSLRNEGFSEPGYNSFGDTFRWSSAFRSRLLLPLQQRQGYAITLNMAIPSQIPEVSVFVNNQYLTTFSFEGWEWREHSVAIPRTLLTQPTTFTLRYHYHVPPELPLKHGRLGNAVAFKSITFTPLTTFDK